MINSPEAHMSSVDYFTRAQAESGWARVLQGFMRFASAQPGQRTLDVGCGPGALVRWLAAAGCAAVGVDADPAMTARARDLARSEAPPSPARFVTGSALALPFAAASFDLVTASNVLFLLREPAPALAEMARACRPGGAVALLNPAPRFSMAAAEAHAAAAGLTGFDRTSFVNWGRLAETHHRFSPADLQRLCLSAGLQIETIAERIGPGFALLVRAAKPG